MNYIDDDSIDELLNNDINNFYEKESGIDKRLYIIPFVIGLVISVTIFVSGILFYYYYGNSIMSTFICITSICDIICLSILFKIKYSDVNVGLVFNIFKYMFIIFYMILRITISIILAYYYKSIMSKYLLIANVLMLVAITFLDGNNCNIKKEN